MYQSPPPGYSTTATSSSSTAAAAADPCGLNPSPTSAAEKRLLYIGNLTPECTEQMLIAVFAQFGQCLACRIIRSGNSLDSYAFMEFPTHQQAQVALTAMNRISLMGRELRVNWGTAPGTKPDSAKGSHVFVGDLHSDVEDKEILDLFLPYGPIIDCRVVRHTDGGCKTYAFVTFENEPDAKAAIEALNGSLLRHRPIRVSQSSKRPGGGGTSRRPLRRTHEEVFNETSECNTSVYFGGIHRGLTEELAREHFDQFGEILDVKVHEEKGFAFLRFDSHENATKAIVGMQGAQIAGYPVKVGWGKGEYHPQSNFVDQSYGAEGVDNNSYDDPAYTKYYEDYMEWYRQYGQAYYAQYYGQYGQSEQVFDRNS